MLYKDCSDIVYQYQMGYPSGRSSNLTQQVYRLFGELPVSGIEERIVDAECRVRP